MQPALLFVSDTNVWIDFDKVDLLDALFALPFRYCTTDFAAEELAQPDAGGLIKRGLEIKSLEDEAMIRIGALMQKYPRIPGRRSPICHVSSWPKKSAANY